MVPLPAKATCWLVPGKGNKTRMVPVLQNVLQPDPGLRRDLSASAQPTGRSSFGARGGPLARESFQLTMERMRGAFGLPTVPRRTHWRTPLPPSAEPRRRPARDPGIARPRLALDHADLYRIDSERLLEVYRTAHPRRLTLCF